MSCKANKWWPHNWLCLKGLYYIFIALFYIMGILMFIWLGTTLVEYNKIPAELHNQLPPHFLLRTVVSIVLNSLAAMLGFLTIAKILHVLRKIKKAVAPCCCEATEAKEEVVAVITEEK